MTFTRKKTLSLLFAVLTLICMICIFRFSMEDSNESAFRSGQVTKFIIKMINRNYDDLSPSRQREILKSAGHIVRKIAHFTIYMTLGFLSSVSFGRRKLITLKSLVVLVICFIYACSDEIHQYFVPGRGCELRDVMIDTSGAVVGILISMAVFALFKKRDSNNS